MASTVAIDANLIILLVVGNVARGWIGRHKCLKAFVTRDYELLIGTLQQFERVVVTPNALTEASNLVVQGVSDPLRAEFLKALGRITATSNELYIKSKDAVDDPAFIGLGLTDSAWLIALDQDTTLLTTDLALYLAALQRGFRAANFNHMREHRLG